MPETEKYPFDPHLREAENENSELDDISALPPVDIVAYNELRSCADLHRMWTEGQIKIDPEFQRGLVWKPADQTRFIDSLIKQLPIPSMCISYDSVHSERFVIDGLQRIKTIIDFLSDDTFRLSVLKDVIPEISGKTVKEIKTKNKDLYDKLKNWSIPITVIRCNHLESSHMDYLYTIFHRLNTGGLKLNSQEIRNCIFAGNFNSFIKETVSYGNYNKLFKIEKNKNYRFAFEELNVRFFAFSERLDKYQGQLSKFLNDYMYDMKGHQKSPALTKEEISIKKKHFNETIDMVYNRVFAKKSIDKISKTVIESVMIGVGKNLKYLKTLPPKETALLYNKLKNDKEFSTSQINEGTLKKGKVTRRIKKAIKIFSGK